LKLPPHSYGGQRVCSLSPVTFVFYLPVCLHVCVVSIFLFHLKSFSQNTPMSLMSLSHTHTHTHTHPPMSLMSLSHTHTHARTHTCVSDEPHTHTHTTPQPHRR